MAIKKDFVLINALAANDTAAHQGCRYYAWSLGGADPKSSTAQAGALHGIKGQMSPYLGETSSGIRDSRGHTAA